MGTKELREAVRAKAALDGCVFYDLETTGADRDVDRIVELAFYGADGTALLVTRINPGVPIPAEATKAHGITDADVADAPPFSAVAPEVQAIIAGATLVAYNGIRFDAIVLDRELREAGQPGLDRVEGRIEHAEVDPFAIWQKSEPRDLSTAVRRFAGTELVDAHSAGADAAALPGVLVGMLVAFGLADKTLPELVELSRPEGMVDRDGRFKRREDNVVVFAFGKHEGVPIRQEPGYLEWMLDRDFSAETKWWARRFLTAIRAR